MKILVVCLGNICRSPMAEGILRKKAKEKNIPLVVDSAGTANYHVGDSPDMRAIFVAKKYGVDISGLIGRQFNANDFDAFDRIYAMDTSTYQNILKSTRNKNDINKVQYFLTDGEKGVDVHDPWFGDTAGFYPVFELLEKASEIILDNIKDPENNQIQSSIFNLQSSINNVSLSHSNIYL